MNKQDDIGLLIRDAGARELVSAERLEKARERVGDHWQGIVAERRQHKHPSRTQHFALAASLVAVVAIGFLISRPETTLIGINVATVNRVIGDVRIDGAAATPGYAITEKSVIETSGDGMLALSLNSGQSLRIDNDTRLVARGGNSYALEQGGIYVDSGPDSRTAPVSIATHLGTATDVGTQFQVRVLPGSLQISVREGLVALNRGDAPSMAIELGTLFELSAAGGTSQREVAPDDEIWEWTSTILPNFDTDGAKLSQYLTWYARERGVQLEWFDRASQDNAERATLDGSIQGLSLEEGLQAVRKIAPFEYTLADGILTVQVH